MQEAGDRHGHAQIFCCREGEPNILLAEWRREPGRLEFSIRDELTIDL